jgi:uncharacterized protein YigE (DUF2233 family)
MSGIATQTRPRWTLSSRSGRLWHSVYLHPENTWTQFLDVEAEAGERGRFVDVSCASSFNRLHVCAITDDGRLWHSIREGDPWSQFADVEVEAGERGRFVDVSCAFQYNPNIPPEMQQLHVCAITDDGRLWHSIRQGDPWSQFADVEGEAGERGRFVKVSCFYEENSNIPPEAQRLHVCAITADGRLWYASRQGDPWTRFLDVETKSGERGRFVDVSCAVGHGLHICAITDDGRLWHAIRFGTPWTQFRDVEGETGERGRFVNVACGHSGPGDRLHVYAITDDGRLWYSLRRGDPWRRFRDVEAATGERGVFSKVVCDQYGTHVCGITVEP